MTHTSVKTKILSSLTAGTNAQVAYGVAFNTALFGDIHSPPDQPVVMRFVHTDGRCGMAWTDRLILPQQAGGNSLVMEYRQALYRLRTPILGTVTAMPPVRAKLLCWPQPVA